MIRVEILCSVPVTAPPNSEVASHRLEVIALWISAQLGPGCGAAPCHPWRA